MQRKPTRHRICACKNLFGSCFVAVAVSVAAVFVVVFVDFYMWLSLLFQNKRWCTVHLLACIPPYCRSLVPALFVFLFGWKKKIQCHFYCRNYFSFCNGWHYSLNIWKPTQLIEWKKKRIRFTAKLRKCDAMVAT